MFFAIWPKNLTPTASLGPFLAFGLFKSFLTAIFVQGMFLRISKMTDKELISVNAKIERFFSWFCPKHLRKIGFLGSENKNMKIIENLGFTFHLL